MNTMTMSRRGFVKTAAAAAVLSGVAAEGVSHLVPVAEAHADEGGGETIVRSMCRACIHNCGVKVHMRNGRAVKIEGDEADPMSHGAICPKGLAGIQALYNPMRMKYPMRRVGERGTNEWERISWEEAINEIADALWEAYQSDGPQALVCSTGGGGNPQFFSPHRFLGVWGGGNFFEPGCAQCYLPRNCVQPKMNGTSDTSIADGNCSELYFDDTPTECLVCWGVCPSYDSPGTGGVMMSRLRAQGVRTVVIDPRLTPDAAKADVWLQIRPGTDVALMLSWMKYIVDNEAYDEEFCLKWTNLPFLVNEETMCTYRASELGLGSDTDGVVWDKKTQSVKALPYPWDDAIEPALDGEFEVDGKKSRTAFRALKDNCAAWTFEKTAEVCWVDADDIEAAVKLFIEGSPQAGIALGVATDQYIQSAQAPEGVTILDCLMGNVQCPGAMIQLRASKIPCNYIVLPFDVFGEHPLQTPYEEKVKRLGYIEHKALGHWLASQIPAVFDAIDTGKPYQPKIWIDRSGNKLAMLADASHKAAVGKKMELIVHMYMYPTSMSVELADIILPTAEWLETAYAQDRMNMYFARRPVTQLYEAVDECMIWSWIAKALADRGHKRFQQSFDEEVATKFLSPYWTSYDQYKDYIAYRVGSDYFGDETWTWDKLDKTLPAAYKSMEDYQNDVYYSYQATNPETGKPVGFGTTSGKCEPYFDGMTIMGRTGGVNGADAQGFTYPPASVDYLPLPHYVEPTESPLTDTEYPLVLTQGRIPFYHHGTLRNVPYLRELYPVAEIWVNPRNAKDAGVETGDWVSVESRRGAISARVLVTEGIAPGVTYMERFWNPELLDSDDPSRSWKVMNVNVLTKGDGPFNPEFGTYTLRGITVKITKVDGPPEGVWIEPADFEPWMPQPSDPTGGAEAVYDCGEANYA